jgi:hypothetical protein
MEPVSVDLCPVSDPMELMPAGVFNPKESVPGGNSSWGSDSSSKELHPVARFSNSNISANLE